MPAVSQGLLVGFATLYAFRFRFPLKHNANLVQTLRLYSDCSGLSRASAEPEPGWPRKTTATAFEVVCGWSVADTVFYDVIIIASRRRSISHLLVTSPSVRPDHPTLGTWLGNYASSLWRPCGEGMLIISVSELLKLLSELFKMKIK